MLIDGQAQSNAPSTNKQQENNQKEMKQYKNINTALKYEEMAVNADGSFYCNEPMAQELDNILGDYITLNESLASHSETIQSLNSKIANLQDELTKAENNSSSVTEANEGLEARISELETEIAKAEETTRSLTDKIAELESQLSAKDALLTEKDKEIEELSQEGTQSPTPSNGQKGTVAKSPVNIYKSEMSAKEMREAQQERIKQLSRGI
jgi:chromosome segregation ATPase